MRRSLVSLALLAFALSVGACSRFGGYRAKLAELRPAASPDTCDPMPPRTPDANSQSGARNGVGYLPSYTLRQLADSGPSTSPSASTLRRYLAGRCWEHALRTYFPN